MKDYNYLVSHTSFQVVDSRKQKNLNHDLARNFYGVEDLLYSCDIGLSTVVSIKKHFFKKY